jgi:hypothetical protein
MRRRLNRIKGLCLHGKLENPPCVQLNATVLAKKGAQAFLHPDSTVHRQGEGLKPGPHTSSGKVGDDHLVDGLAGALDHITQSGLSCTRKASLSGLEEAPQRAGGSFPVELKNRHTPFTPRCGTVEVKLHS